jgi:hypothetical protein
LAKDLPDRKHAPKKTGKRMKPPEDKKDLIAELDKPTGKQASLLVEQPPKPKVVGDRMEAFYIKPVWMKAPKSGDIVIIMRMSLPIEKEHKEVLPKIVADGYNDVKKKGHTGANLEVPGQKVTFYLTPDDKDPVLELPAARFVHANLRLIQRKGEGSARKVIRFAFELHVKFEAHVAKFAELNLGNHYWIKMDKMQGELFEDEGEEEE